MNDQNCILARNRKPFARTPCQAADLPATASNRPTRVRDVRPLFALGLAFWLAGSAAGAAGVVISEFMASNGNILADEDGDFPDWIELYNDSPVAVNLNGWFLTDNAANLTKWRFPAVTLEPRGFLVVFASGKNRATPGAPLHTSFSLAADGEYLALVRPDRTVASELAPAFPEQFRNVSYGRVQTVTTNVLLALGAPGRYLVPADDSAGLTWVQPAFADAGWSRGPGGFGFETEVAGFAVRNVKANVLVNTLATAEGVLANPAQQVSVAAETAPVLNYFNTGGEGHYDNNRAFPGQTIGVDVEDFVVEATATITFPTAGPWTFGVNSDDGFQLTIGPFSLAYPDPRGPADSLGVFQVPAAGDYPLRLVFYERGGGSGLELFAAPGDRPAWDAISFRLVGDTANGGLAVRSVPVAGGGGESLRAWIATDLEPVLKGRNASAYFRLPFVVGEPGALDSLFLRLRYNDGFSAWLNGALVAQANTPPLLAWNSAAPAARDGAASRQPELFNLTAELGRLAPGTNLLALQGLNHAADDPNFLLAPELIEYRVVSGDWGYFTQPTPGAVNGAGVRGFLSPPRFSVERGFYDAPFDLELTTRHPGAQIRYTTNGTLPTPENGLTYTGPVRVAGTTVVRAAVFQEGYQSSPAVTHTYLFLDDILRQSPTGEPPPGWPASWGANVVNYGMDPRVVNDPRYAPTLKEDLKSLPSFSIVMDLKDLFDPATGIYANPGQDGRDWERPCSVELIHPGGTPGFQVPAGIRIRGGFSRSTGNPKHAFRLFFREEYGAAKLRYPLFGDAGTDTFDKIDLRTFQNYSWSFQGDSRGVFVRDQLNRDLQLAMGHPGERGEFYHLYINGQYWGLYNTCERPEASYGATYFGGRREDFDTLKVEAGPYTVQATDGNLDAWTRLYNLARAGLGTDAAYEFVQGNNPDGTRNPAYEKLVDVPNLIDYMLVILYGGNLDAPISNFLGNTRPNNFYALRDRTGPDGFRFFIHDAEHTLLDVNENRLGPYPAGDSSVVYSNPQWLWQKLQAHPEFRLRVADHVHRHFFNGGVLTPERVREMFLRRTAQIERAVAGESARWGDAKRATPLTPADWRSAVNNILSNFIPQRSGIVLNQLRAAGLYPSIVAPTFNQHGGAVPPGFALTMSAPAGTIYYTLDGTDPRLRGGALSPRAMRYTGPIVLNETTPVLARVLSGTNWSALNAADFVLIQTFTNLFITEIMYHPPDTEEFAGEQLEFIELKNVGAEELDLSGVRFSEGLSYTFPLGTRLAPGAFVVLVSDPAAFATRYPGVASDGVFSGRLSNAGERLTLVHAVGTPIFSVRYGDAEPWPVAADGAGFSLVPLQPNLNPDPDNPAHWRASSLVGGSPGRDDPPANVPEVWITEILTHTDPPQVDAIELHNPNPFPVDVGYWYLTDTRTTPKKFRIPAPRVIPAGGFAVLDEREFNAVPGDPGSFSLSSAGEEIYLYSANAAGELTGYSHGFAFGAAANGESFGRHVTSTGEIHYPPQQTLTLGGPNAGPRVGPLVINEIGYHPRPGEAEFVELKNITAAPVPLFHPEHPDLTWRLNGVGFRFPPGVTVAPQGLLLVVSGDPEVFRARHRVPAEGPVFGPFPGVLQDDGEQLQLLRPDAPNVGPQGEVIVPEILVDEVRYRTRAPWPAGASGTGASLERLVADAYGNDPANWRVSPGAPSPGLENSGNRPPQVAAGSDQSHTTDRFPLEVRLAGAASDDGLPTPPGRLTLAWSQVGGPGAVWFGDAAQPETTAYLPGVGTYLLRLTASDGALEAADELVITVSRATAPAVLVPQGSVWSYWDRGTDPGPDWADPAFDDRAWSAGPARLGYGGDGEVTVVSYGPNASDRYITTFFRHRFVVPEPAAVTALKVGLQRDDGGIVYLNGTEIFRSNLPEGPITLTTRASSVVGGADEQTFFETAVDPALLVAGTNVLAVRIHQANPTSSDVGFDLYLTGTALPANRPPAVVVRGDTTVSAAQPAQLDAEVSDDGLPIPPGVLTLRWEKVSGPGAVEFTQPTAPRTTARFSQPGAYVLRLRVDDGATSASDTLTVQVLGDDFAQWQTRYFSAAELLDPALSGEAADPDGDGHTNRQEFRAGTHPRDPQSVLRLTGIALEAGAPGVVHLRFPAVAGREYVLQRTAAPATGPWETVLTLPPATADGEVTVSDPLPAAVQAPARFYRIVIP